MPLRASRTCVMTLAQRLRAPDTLIAVALFGASLLLYTLTLAPSVVTLFDDSLEFQLVTYQLGIAHPTGYPLYTLLGKLFTMLPLGNVAYRVNWLSAVFGAATVALVYLLAATVAEPAQKLRGDNGAQWPRRMGAALGAALLAVGLVFWQQATIAEVYPLNAFFVALLLLAAIRRPCSAGKLVGLAFLAGLALTHHRTVVLLLPALALYLLLTCDLGLLFRPKTLLLSLLFFALPLLLYLYLPLRGHVGSLDGTYQNTWAGFWRQVTASGYNTFIFDNPFNQSRDLTFYVTLLADQFYTTALGLVGLAFLAWFGQGRYLLLTGAAFVTYFIFNLFYNVADIDVFFIPNFLIWAAWSGAGAAFLLQTAADLPRRWLKLSFAGLILLVFGVMLGQLARSNWPTVQAAHSWAVHDYGIDMLRQPLENDAVIVGIVGEMTLLRYFQQTEGLRPDVETVAADREADRLAAVEARLAQRRPVYLTRQLPGAAERWSLAAVGPLIKVMAQPAAELPPGVEPVNQPVTPEIALAGYTVGRAPHTGPGPAPVRLTLYWQAAGPIPADLKVSARLVTSAGETLAAVDGVPVHFAYPTSAWRPGEIVADVYDLPLPATAAGPVSPLLIWYNPAQNAAEVGRVELPPINLD